MCNIFVAPNQSWRGPMFCFLNSKQIFEGLELRINTNKAQYKIISRVTSSILVKKFAFSDIRPRKDI